MTRSNLPSIWGQLTKDLWLIWIKLWVVTLPWMVLVPETSEFLAMSMAFMLTGVFTVSIGKAYAHRKDASARIDLSTAALFRLWKRIIPITLLLALVYGEWYMFAAVWIMLIAIPVVARNK